MVFSRLDLTRRAVRRFLLPCDFRCSSSEGLPGGVRVEKFWQVSNYGRCRSRVRTISWGTLKSGYRCVEISGNQHYVHRLVAFAFLGPPPSELAQQVHHRDGNPSNNHVDNLEYATQSENILHSYSNPSRRNGGQYFTQGVMWRPMESKSWTTSPSIKQAAAELGISTQTVSAACRQSKLAKGFEFQLASRKDMAMLEGEEWRDMYDPVSGDKVPGRRVSSLGRIQFQNGRISCGYKANTGYYRTGLRLHSHCRTELVHRLVAFAFLGPPVNSQRIHVNHKDMDKGNNAAHNLEYVTPAENMVHRYANGCTTPRSDRKPVESRPVGSNHAWDWHPSISSAASMLGVAKGGISKCIHGSRKQTGGFEFRLAQPVEAAVFVDEEWRIVDVAAHLRDRASRQKGVYGR